MNIIYNVKLLIFMYILLISRDFEDQFSQIIPTTEMINNSVDSLSDSKHCKTFPDSVHQ